jgi:hypothetical protein
MRTTLIHLAAGGVAAVAIIAAPLAQAGPLPKLCVATGAATQCESYDNGEIARPLRSSLR